jgi:hypothetical protein
VVAEAGGQNAGRCYGGVPLVLRVARENRLIGRIDRSALLLKRLPETILSPVVNQAIINQLFVSFCRL